MSKPSIRPLLLPLVALSLNACTLSPLEKNDPISITGQIENADGSASKNLAVTLKPSFNAGQTTLTDDTGSYRFGLLGDQTQFANVATSLNLQADLGEGQNLTQSFTALKTRITLPTMRIWDGLDLPAASTQLAGESGSFSWKPPAAVPRNYRFSLLNPLGQTIWTAQTDQLSAQLPLAVMEKGKTYAWQVEAIFPDYTAASRKRAVAAEPELRTAPVQSIQLGGQNYPAFYDSDYGFDVANRLDSGSNRSLELVISLQQASSLEGLYWNSETGNAEVEIRSAAQGTPILTRKLGGTQLLNWPAVKTDKLYLRIYPDTPGFLDLVELRPLTR